MTTIGLDIGGANLKAVFLSGKDDQQPRAVEIAFPMWTNSPDLATAIDDIIKQLGTDAKDCKIAVTMTGELADCFSSKKEGVVFIADAIRETAGQERVSFYQVDGNWCDYESVEQNWSLLAASNWHAMAQIGARQLPQQTGLIVDIGSTTTDIIPVSDGVPNAVGTNDFTRLKNFELIYAGVGRTPVCSLIQSVKVDGQNIALAREFFATINDALIYLKLTPEDPNNTNSADGRPNSRVHAEHRLARMACSDVEEVGTRVVDRIASSAIEAFRLLLVEAIGHALRRSEVSIGSVLLVGLGSFFAESVLAEQFPDLSRVLLSDLISPSANVCGPAYAVAALLEDRH